MSTYKEIPRVYTFGLTYRRPTDEQRAELIQIALAHGCEYCESEQDGQDGQYAAWFAVPHRGEPHDINCSADVFCDITSAELSELYSNEGPEAAE